MKIKGCLPATIALIIFNVLLTYIVSRAILRHDTEIKKPTKTIKHSPTHQGNVFNKIPITKKSPPWK